MSCFCFPLKKHQCKPLCGPCGPCGPTGATGITPPLASGTYSPTFTLTSSPDSTLASSLTLTELGPFHFSRVGSTVTVAGMYQVTAPSTLPLVTNQNLTVTFSLPPTLPAPPTLISSGVGTVSPGISGSTFTDSGVLVTLTPLAPFLIAVGDGITNWNPATNTTLTYQINVVYQV